MKFTFKRHDPTGPYRSFSKPYWDIKVNKKVVGNIHGDSFAGYAVSLAVAKEPTKEEPAPFKWVRFKVAFYNIEEQKSALNKACDTLMARHKLHMFEE